MQRIFMLKMSYKQMVGPKCQLVRVDPKEEAWQPRDLNIKLQQEVKIMLCPMLCPECCGGNEGRQRRLGEPLVGMPDMPDR